MESRIALPFPFPLDPCEIKKRRHEILSALTSTDEGFAACPVRRIHQRTLESMLDLYDQRFLGGFLSRKLGRIAVTLSSRLTSSAGKFICTKGAFGRITGTEIRMSSDYLFRLSEGPFTLNGLEAATAQEAFLIVFEHELCHAVETALFRETGHSARFLRLANGLFGHTATRHSLPTRKAEAAKDGVRAGAKAAFAYQGRKLTGVITYVGKTATVMVPSAAGAYRDAKGRRYEKYRVPVSKLDIVP